MWAANTARKEPPMRNQLSIIKSLPALLVLPIVAFYVSGCSVQWREADSGLSSDEVMEVIENALAEAQTSSTSGAAEFKALLEEPGGNLYFAWGSLEPEFKPMGPPWSLLSLVDFSVFGRPELGAIDLDEAMVAYIDHPERGEAALLVSFRAQGDDTMTTRVFRSLSAPRVVEGEYLADLDQLLLATFDVETNEDLKPVIQLRVFDLNQDGEEQVMGKFSTLVGYSR